MFLVDTHAREVVDFGRFSCKEKQPLAFALFPLLFLSLPLFTMCIQVISTSAVRWT